MEFEFDQVAGLFEKCAEIRGHLRFEIFVEFQLQVELEIMSVNT